MYQEDYLRNYIKETYNSKSRDEQNTLIQK